MHFSSKTAFSRAGVMSSRAHSRGPARLYRFDSRALAQFLAPGVVCIRRSNETRASRERASNEMLPAIRKNKVGVTRLHMEEDSAKMNHQGAESLSGSTHSLIDFNRAGTPLAEIVSEPDMRAGIEAAEYGRELQRVSSTRMFSSPDYGWF